jgi:hypothetical protein
MSSSTKLVAIRPRPAAAKPSALTPELKSFIDRVIVPILVKEFVAQVHEKSIAPERQIAEIYKGVASCESMIISPDAEGAR